MELSDAAASVLAEGRQAYIAIESRQGPHVTPELYTWSGDRLWFAAATPTLKARVLENGSWAAALVPVAGRSVLLCGDVQAFDLRRPQDLARHATDVPATMRAAASYGVSNATDLVGFVRDLWKGNAGGRVPAARVFFALTPHRVEVFDDDIGGPAGGQPVVAAFPGPIAAAARWFDDEQRMFVSPTALDLLDGERTVPVAVVLDEYNGPGPAAKTGTLVRGEGAIADDGCVTVTANRTVDWTGVAVTARD